MESERQYASLRPKIGLLVNHVPSVKSGNATGELPGTSSADPNEAESHTSIIRPKYNSRHLRYCDSGQGTAFQKSSPAHFHLHYCHAFREWLQGRTGSAMVFETNVLIETLVKFWDVEPELDLLTDRQPHPRPSLSENAPTCKLEPLRYLMSNFNATFLPSRRL